jgi:Concanavalin A-like lectin/glucanases superfamily
MATNTWQSNSAGNWSNSANWSAGHAPLSNEDVVFGASHSGNCTIDIVTVNINSLDASAFAGSITNTTATTVNITGKCIWSTGGFVFGSGSTWNVGSDFGCTTTGETGTCDGHGATVNLTGGYLYSFNSLAATTPYPIINIPVGTTVKVPGTGSEGFWGQFVMHINGTLAIGEAVAAHDQGVSDPCDFYISSTGSIINNPDLGNIANNDLHFSYFSRILQQSGTVDCGTFSIYYPQVGYYIAPSVYRSPIISIAAYAPAGVATLSNLIWAVGTTTFTADGTPVTGGVNSSIIVDTQHAAPITWGCTFPAGALVQFGHTHVNWTLTGATITMTDQGGILEFTNATDFVPSATKMGALKFSGGSVVLGGPLICTRLAITGGKFSPNGYNITVDNDIVINGNLIVSGGLNGSTITYGGSFQAVGTSGSRVNLQATGAWSLVSTGANPESAKALYTANADYTDFAYCSASGLTIQAVNCTNGGNNSGINFAASGGTRQSTSVLCAVSSSASGTTATIELSILSGLVAVYENGTQVCGATNVSSYSVGTVGIRSYYDGSYQNCALNIFQAVSAGSVPSVPLNLSVSTIGVATWHRSVGGVTSYTLQRSPQGANTWTTVYTGNNVTFSDSISGLVGNYSYQISATNVNGTSLYSSVYTVNYPLPNGGTKLLSASNQYYTVTNPFANNSAFSASAWFTSVFPNALQQYTGPFGTANTTAFNQGFGAYFDGSVAQNLLCWIQAYNGTFVTLPNPNGNQDWYDKWHHVVMTWDGTTLKAYLDNVAGTPQAYSSSVTEGTNFTLGANYPGTFYLAPSMLLANVRIWSRALTSTEVTSLYNSGHSQTYLNLTGTLLNNLLASWDFTSASTLTTDSTTNSRTLTNNGAATYVAGPS